MTPRPSRRHGVESVGGESTEGERVVYRWRERVPLGHVQPFV